MRVMCQIAMAATLAGGTAFADDWAKTFAVGTRPEIRVETDDGSVRIRPGEDTKIVARVTTLGWKIAPGEVQVRESQTGDRVELIVRITHRPFTFNSSGRWIRVELQVPRQIRSDVRTGDGNIDIQGLDGETRLHTGDGRIDAGPLDGSLSAESGDGHMRVRGRLDLLTLHTGDGSIEADVLPGSKMSSGWRVETGDGSVTMRLPRDFGADLELHTGDGHITMDLPALNAVSEKQGQDVHARLNGGGKALSVRTGDGSIHIGPL
ncbi:MAG: DUF4097 domain-containing protein [Acidobacteriia bacterium]|nr:DUF4097 domain-containing protein [Terriglobia bacterium]